MKERASFVEDMLEGSYLFEPPQDYDEKTVRKKWKENTAQIIEKLSLELAQADPFESTQIEETFKGFLEANELGLGQVLPNLRVILTGVGAGPSIFEIAELLGKEETLERIKKGLEKLSQWQQSS